MLSEMKSSNYCQSLITACYGQLSNITLTEQLSVFLFQNAAKLYLNLKMQKATVKWSLPIATTLLMLCILYATTQNVKVVISLLWD